MRLAIGGKRPKAQRLESFCSQVVLQGVNGFCSWSIQASQVKGAWAIGVGLEEERPGSERVRSSATATLFPAIC
jgi:hypothetical protein